MTRLDISLRFAPYSATPELAVRHAVDVAHTDGMYRESFAPGAWLDNGRGATVQYDHDTEDIGQVVNVTACSDGWFYADCVVETADPEVLARCKVGTPVSTGARILTRATVTHTDTRVCRHGMAWLEHIAILKPGSLPGYRGAKILEVHEVKSTASRQAGTPTNQADWRSRLPHGFEDFAEENIDLQPGDELCKGGAIRGIRWDGERFTQPHARAA